MFGGAIHIPGVRYVDFLMPGIFVQTVCFGAQNTGVGLATDLQTGLIERFRSLPMARSAVLAGRTAADAVRNVFVISLMVAVGYAVGFRFGGACRLRGAPWAQEFTLPRRPAFAQLLLHPLLDLRLADRLQGFPHQFGTHRGRQHRQQQHGGAHLPTFKGRSIEKAIDITTELDFQPTDAA